MDSQSKQIVAVDLFCGIGGMTYGFNQAGIPVKTGIDIDETCKYSFETNNQNSKFIHSDIGELDISTIEQCFENTKISVLIGCAPCQTFSRHSQRYRKEKDLIIHYIHHTSGSVLSVYRNCCIDDSLTLNYLKKLSNFWFSFFKSLRRFLCRHIKRKWRAPISEPAL